MLAKAAGVPADRRPFEAELFKVKGEKAVIPDEATATTYMRALEGSTWRIWLAPSQDWSGPHGPGFNQRFIGEISAGGNTIDGRWERGMGNAGDDWETDFPISYVRKQR